MCRISDQCARSELSCLVLFISSAHLDIRNLEAYHLKHKVYEDFMVRRFYFQIYLSVSSTESSSTSYSVQFHYKPLLHILNAGPCWTNEDSVQKTWETAKRFWLHGFMCIMFICLPFSSRPTSLSTVNSSVPSLLWCKINGTKKTNTTIDWPNSSFMWTAHLDYVPRWYVPKTCCSRNESFTFRPTI